MDPPLISSLENPRIKAVVKLRQHRQRERGGLLVAEGLREVARALGAGLAARELFVCPSQLGLDTPAQLRSALAPHHPNLPHDLPLPLTEVSPPVMQKLAYRQTPEGVVGTFVQPSWDLSHLASLDLSAAPLLLAVGLEKPGNLGAMARTAAAAGCPALLVADSVVDPFNPNAIRASTGAVFGLPILVASGSEMRSALRARGIRLAVTSPAAEQLYTACDLTGLLAIAIGAEDQGLDAAWLESGDLALGLPMRTNLCDSLNASVTAGIVLYESLRQRGQ